MTQQRKPRVVVGMSGGVDSAVSALLLVRQGFEVIGVFMQNWDDALNNDIRGNPRAVAGVIDGPCPVQADYEAALQAAKVIGIPLHRVDFIKQYWDSVFENFIAEYRAGRTPNPDILCNKHIKFAAFAEYANKTFGTPLIAMGHYASVTKGPKGARLLKGADENKDQSYFLAQLSQQQITGAIFPVGTLLKEQVRKIAKDNGLPNADRPDSTGICFIGERNFREFLQNYIPALPGDVIDLSTGKKIGEHIGVMYYTIGQRRGLHLGGNEERYFVAGRDVKNKRLLVAPASQEDRFLVSRSCTVSELNWINEVPQNKKTYFAKFRYRQKDLPVQVSIDGAVMRVFYGQGVKAVAAGQQLVLYDGKTCLGGGVVQHVDSAWQNV